MMMVMIRCGECRVWLDRWREIKDTRPRRNSIFGPKVPVVKWPPKQQPVQNENETEEKKESERVTAPQPTSDNNANTTNDNDDDDDDDEHLPVAAVAEQPPRGSIPVADRSKHKNVQSEDEKDQIPGSNRNSADIVKQKESGDVDGEAEIPTAALATPLSTPSKLPPEIKTTNNSDSDSDSDTEEAQLNSSDEEPPPPPRRLSVAGSRRSQVSMFLMFLLFLFLFLFSFIYVSIQCLRVWTKIRKPPVPPQLPDNHSSPSPSSSSPRNVPGATINAVAARLKERKKSRLQESLQKEKQDNKPPTPPPKIPKRRKSEAVEDTFIDAVFKDGLLGIGLGAKGSTVFIKTVAEGSQAAKQGVYV